MAKSRRPPTEPLRMRGSPNRLSAFLPLGDDDDPSVIDLHLPKLEGALVVQQVEGVGARVTVSVPPLTPPGSYQGIVRVGAREQPVLIEVEPRVRLSLDPRKLYFQGAPKATLEADVNFTNLGNVAVELPAQDSFTLFQSGGLSEAIGRAISSEQAKDERVIDAIADAAKDAVGGMVSIKVDGAGQLAAGETRTVHLTLSLPDRLQTGHTYWGTWDVYNINYPVRVEVTGSTKPTDKPGPQKEPR